MFDLIVYALVLIAAITAFCMIVVPPWGVWAARKRGEAAFADAMGEQRIQIAKAHSRLEAAENNKKAAIIEAEAVASQIEKIGKELLTHDLYLRWQWIKMMEERNSKSDTIYVPTEANLPILEATRRPK